MTGAAGLWIFRRAILHCLGCLAPVRSCMVQNAGATSMAVAPHYSNRLLVTFLCSRCLGMSDLANFF